MNLAHLQQHYQELLSYMKEHKYSAGYINKFHMQILYILKNADTAGWKSYQESYEDYQKVYDKTVEMQMEKEQEMIADDALSKGTEANRNMYRSR